MRVGLSQELNTTCLCQSAERIQHLRSIGTELLNSLRLMFSRLASHRCPNGHYVKPGFEVALMQECVCPECGEQIHTSEVASQEMYSWFVDTALEDVASVLAERDGMLWERMNKKQREMYLQMIQRGGFHIYTTLDMKVQDQVDKIYTDLNQIPDTRGGQQLQSGIVVIDNRTGDIVAMAGGVGEKVVFDGYNMATDAKRQVGSSLKPLSVYAPAFESGKITPATVIKDMPIFYNEDKTDPNNVKVTAFPRNSDSGYSYTTTVLNGIANSLNAVSVNTLDKIGTRYSFDFLKNSFRINNLVELDEYGNTDISYSPLGLGGLTEGATVRDVASAYATFANKGVYRQGRTYTKVYNSQGKLIIDNTQVSEQILSEKTVDYVNYCLDKAVEYGTGTVADFKGMNICGKTGTTNSKKDRYFCGYTGYYTAAVWCGFEIPAEINLTGGGGNPAAQLWRKVMKPLHEGKENIELYDPDKMVEVTVCLDSGKLATDACSCDIRGDIRTQTVLVYEEDVPTELCDKHIALDYCISGNGVANEYCKKFASVGMSLMEQKALVIMTQAQVDELAAATGFKLDKKYLDERYVYLVDAYGNPTPFLGFIDPYAKKDEDAENNPEEDPNLGMTQGRTENCVTCPLHTQEAWEDYRAQNPWVDYPNYGQQEEEKPWWEILPDLF